MHELLKIATEIKPYTPVSKFTPIVEDVNLIHSEKYETIVKQLKTVSPLIKSVELIDKFQDKLTLRLTFHSDEKQLSSEDIAPIRFQLSNLNRP
jgi:phenylalanyl-tRNA synthetase beta subunit